MSLDKINDLKLHNGSMEGELQEALLRVLSRGWFALGPEVEAFEREFAHYCRVDHCVTVANGTDALELALRACGVGERDEVITAANAGMYCSSAVLAVGATPSYADIDEETLTLDPERVAEKITSRTRAVVATHLYGKMADMPAFRALASDSGVALIEDCAQAHGAELDGVRAGAWGDAGAFSFYPTKNLGALGDGGAVVTRLAEVADRIRQLRQYGWKRRYVASLPGGRNSRLDELQAAVLRVKLPKLDGWNKRRFAVAACYSSEIDHPVLRLPCVEAGSHVAHLYVLRTREREALREFLKAGGIASDVHYPLLDYQQPALSDRFSGVHLPVSERVVEQIVTLPCYPELELSDVLSGCRLINSWTMECTHW